MMSEQLLKLEEVKSRYSQKSQINWRDVCRVMLNKSLPIHPFITQFDDKKQDLANLDIYIGLIKPLTPTTLTKAVEADATIEGENFLETLLIQKYRTSQFFEQVIRQGNSKSKGQKLAIMGEPGSGKTLLLQKIGDWILENTEEDVPIWISANEMGTGLLSQYWREKWLHKAAQGGKTPPLDWQEGFEELLNSGRVWLLLDGVDEIEQDYLSTKTEPLSRLLQPLGELIDKVHIVLTCRTHTWQSSQKTINNFESYHTLALSYPGEVKSFIERWFDNGNTALTQHQGEQNLGKQLGEALDEPGRDRLRHWVQNPLCLSLLCRLWQQQPGQLPETQTGLYQQLVEQLYQWKASTVHTTAGQQQQLNKALGKLALKAMQYGVSSRMSHRFVAEVFSEDIALFRLALQLGWLHPVSHGSENPNDKYYAFFDRPFQEYFAASAIEDWRFLVNHTLGNEKSKNESTDVFSSGSYRIFDAQWKPVILLWLGRTDIEVVTKEALIQTLVEFDDRCSHDNYYGKRAYLLAAAGLAEFTTSVKSEEILEQILQWSFGNFQGTRAFAESARLALGETNPSKAIEAIIALIESTTDRDSQKQAFHCVEKLGRGNPEAIAALALLINTTEDQRIRLQAAESLGKVDPGNALAILTLSKRLAGDPQHENWQSALISLTKIGKHHSKAIAALIRLLHSFQDPSIQRQIFQAIELIGKGNGTAIAALVQLIRTSEDEVLRRQAAESLESIDPGNPTAIAILIQLLKNSQNEEVRKEAVYSLGEITPGNPEAINALVAILKDSTDVFLRWTTVTSLGKIASGNPEAIALLEKLIQSSDEEEKLLRKDAIESLGKIDPNNPQVISALVELLQSTDDESIRREAAESLGNLDPGNPSAIVALTQLLHISKDGFTRRQAADSLGKIDPGNLDAVKFLIELLQSHREQAVHSLAAESLGNLGVHNPAAIATLIRLIQTTHDRDTLRCAVKSLGKIGSHNRDVIAILIKVLRTTQDDSIRLQIVDGLIGVLKDKQLLPVVTTLREILADEAHDHIFAYHKLMWHCAQRLPYPEFYQAWHFQSLATATTVVEKPTPIPPVNLTSLKGSDLPAHLHQALFKHPQLSQSTHLVCFDSSSFLDSDNPAVDIYDRMLSNNCPEFHHGLPETMAKLRLYWNSLQRDYRQKTFVLVFYENLSPASTQKFSPAFLEMLGKFNGAICVITEQSVRGLKQFNPQDPQLIQGIINWIQAEKA